MFFGQIQQEFQGVRADRAAHDLREWLRKRYTLQNTASKWATIISVDNLSYASCKNVENPRATTSMMVRMHRNKVAECRKSKSSNTDMHGNIRKKSDQQSKE